jgi:hypothetical protein
LGVVVVRIDAERVLADIDDVLTELRRHIEARQGAWSGLR